MYNLFDKKDKFLQNSIIFLYFLACLITFFSTGKESWCIVCLMLINLTNQIGLTIYYFTFAYSIPKTEEKSKDIYKPFLQETIDRNIFSVCPKTYERVVNFSAYLLFLILLTKNYLLLAIGIQFSFLSVKYIYYMTKIKFDETIEEFEMQ